MKGGVRRRIASALAAGAPRRIPDRECEWRAAVALVLRPPTGYVASPMEMEGLFVQRAEMEDDPWSGHMALPGGRVSSADDDLVETARRETWEETALELARDAFLGRLNDIHPRSRELPSVAVTPFVAWCEERTPVRGNAEIRDHVWVPLRALGDPGRRSALVIRKGELTRGFTTIEYEGYTIWGLTFQIVTDFLRALESAELVKPAEAPESSKEPAAPGGLQSAETAEPDA